MLNEEGEKTRQGEQLQVHGQQMARDEPQSRGRLHVQRSASFQQGKPSSSILELDRVSLLEQAESRRRGSAKTESCLSAAASACPFRTCPGHRVPVAPSLQPHIASHASYHPGSVYWERVHRPGL